MKSVSYKRVWRWISLFTSLVILLTTLQPVGTTAAPQQTIYGVKHLNIQPLYTENTLLCVGQEAMFSVLVVNDIHAGVGGASVHAGNKTINTSYDGLARWTQSVDKAGPITIEISATKEDYIPSPSISVTINAINCEWNISMWYFESYAGQEPWVFQGSIEVETTPFSRDIDGSLALNTGDTLQAQFNGNVYAATQPIQCYATPSVSGNFPIKFSGEYVKGILNITLSAKPVTLPPTVTIKCNFLDPNYKVDPFTNPTRQTFNLVEDAGLNTIVCPAVGCVERTYLSHPEIWPTPREEATLILIINRTGK